MYPFFLTILKSVLLFTCIEQFLMRIHLFALALLPFALTACQSTDLQKVGDVAVTVLQQQNAAKTLAAYEWHLDTGAPKHLELHFADNGRLSIQTSCNTMGGSWEILNNVLSTSNLMSTQMGCSEAAAQQEKMAAELFNQAKLPFVLNLNDVNAPTLSITAANGERHVFTGKMTPETKYGTQAETIFLEVSPETKKCEGVAPQTCLQVKEIKYNEQGIKTYQDANWSLFYSNIEGYQHDPKLHQIIRVKRYEIKNPAADQSKYAYVYDMAVMSGVVEK